MRFSPLIIFFLVWIFNSCSLYKAPNYPTIAGGYPNFKAEDSLLGYLNQDRSCFDVNFYQLDLKIDPKRKRLGGIVKIDFDCTENTRRIQLDLDKRLAISSIKDKNGNELAYHRYHRAVKIDLNEELRFGEHSSIRIAYEGKPKTALRPPWMGGLVWKKKKGKYFCGVACEDDGASVWWPCKDHISDKPDSVLASFSVPKGYMCVSNGMLIDSDTSNSEMDTYSWKTSYPINPYNVTFYLGDYRHFILPYENPGSQLKQLDFYVRPEHLEVAKGHFMQAIQILKVYESFFGPYPWPKDGYKLVDSPYEGMEHQTAIAYGEEFKNSKYLNYDYIILHETAHEWWGNHTTCCDMADLWIHEGFATYAEMLYEERTEGESSYQLSYLINRNMCRNSRPVVGPKEVAYTNFRDNDIYNKGAVVLHMLRKNIQNDSLFFKIIYRFSTEYSDKCATTEDFVMLVNEESGEKYDWFFDQYVYRREAPELKFFYVQVDNNSSEFRYKWNPKRTNENFKMGITIFIDEKPHKIFPKIDTQVLKIEGTNTVINIDQEDYITVTRDKSL